MPKKDLKRFVEISQHEGSSSDELSEFEDPSDSNQGPLLIQINGGHTNPQYSVSSTMQRSFKVKLQGGQTEGFKSIMPNLAKYVENHGDTTMNITRRTTVYGAKSEGRPEADFGSVAGLFQKPETIQDRIEDATNQASVASSTTRSSKADRKSGGRKQRVANALPTRTTKSNADSGNSVEDPGKGSASEAHVASSTTQRSVMVGLEGRPEADLGLAGLFEEPETVQDRVEDATNQASVASSTTRSSKADRKSGGRKQRVANALPTTTTKSNADSGNSFEDPGKGSANEAHVASSTTQSLVVAGLQGSSEESADAIQDGIKGPANTVLSTTKSTEHRVTDLSTTTTNPNADSGSFIEELRASVGYGLQINAPNAQNVQVQATYVNQHQVNYGNNYQDYVKYGDTFAGAINNAVVGGRENSNGVANHGH